jgi:predicted nucleotidyltransferase
MSLAQVKLPEPVAGVVADFVEAALSSLGSDLRSIVLYGSAAEGKLRSTSDVNAIVVLVAFDPAKVDRLREPLRTAYAAVRFTSMFLLESEVSAAVDAFTVKFADVLHRRQVVYGTDPFVGLTPSRGAEIARLKQVLLNLTLRLRQKYLLRSLRDEQGALVVADTAGPIRACAAALLELQGKTAASPKEALENVVARLPGTGWTDVLRHVSEARENRTLPPGTAAPTLLRLIDLTREMRVQVEALG